MAKAQHLIASFLRRRAAWFVVAAWLLLILTILANLTAGVGAGINAFYHPQHEWATYDRAIIRVLYLAFTMSFVAAVGSSIALAFGWRTLASTAVVGCWTVLLAGGSGQMLLVERGPQQFQRYVGQQQFIVPWQYDPRGADTPNRNGFSVRICLTSLLGTYDKACLGGQQMTVFTPELGFVSAVEDRYWERHRTEMTSAGVRDGHQAYIYSIPTDGTGSGPTIRYYRRTGSDGNLLRLITCRGHGFCEHRTLIDRYILDYTAPEAAFPEWEAMDRKLVTLVNSWSRRVD